VISPEFITTSFGNTIVIIIGREDNIRKGSLKINSIQNLNFSIFYEYPIILSRLASLIQFDNIKGI